jgi:hypothetical protein
VGDPPAAKWNQTEKPANQRTKTNEIRGKVVHLKMFHTHTSKCQKKSRPILVKSLRPPQKRTSRNRQNELITELFELGWDDLCNDDDLFLGFFMLVLRPFRKKLEPIRIQCELSQDPSSIQFSFKLANETQSSMEQHGYIYISPRKLTWWSDSDS